MALKYIRVGNPIPNSDLILDANTVEEIKDSVIPSVWGVKLP